MLIEEIDMKHFLSHKDSKIGFSTGVNIIIGKNGAGKSSIVDAMRMALFGNSDIERKIISYNETESSVTVKFRHNMHTYEITRTLENKRGRENTKKAFMTRDGIKIGEGANEVNQAVERELEIGKVAFLNSVYVKQGDIDGLITSRPAERKDIMSEIIGLKDYDKALKNLDPIIKNLENETRDFDAKREEGRDISKRIETYREEIERNRIRKDEIEENIRKLEKERDSIFIKIQSIENKKRTMEQYNKEINEMNNKILTLEAEIKKLEQQKKEYDSNRDELEKMRNDVRYLKRREIREMIRRMNENSEIEKEIEKQKKTMDEYRTQLEKMENLKESYERYEEMQRKFSEMEDEMKLLLRFKEEYEKYRSLFEENRKKIENTNKQRARIIEKIGDKIDLQSLTLDYVEKRRIEKREELRELERKISEEKSSINENRKRIEEIREKMDQLMASPVCPLCGQSIEGHKHDEIFQEFNQGINKINTEIEGSNNHIKALNIKRQRVEDELKIIESREVNEYINLMETLKENEKAEKEYLIKIEENNENREKYEKNQLALQEMGKKIELLREPYRKYVELTGRIESIRKLNLEQTIKEKEEKFNDNQRALREYADLVRLIENGLKIKDLEDIENRVELFSKKVQDKGPMLEIDKRMESIKFYNEQIQEKIALSEPLKKDISLEPQYRKSLREIDEEIERTRKEKEEIIRDTSSKKAETEKLEKDMEEIERYLKNTESAMKSLQFLSKLRKAISRDGIPRALRGIAVESISVQARNIISRFNLAIEDVRLSDDLDVEIMQDGSIKDLSQLSGGERTSLAIGIRLAIAKYLGGDMSTIIMDEPTVYLDEERRNDLRDIIKYSIKELSDENIFPQIIIITHHEELETAADVVYEVRKENGVSFVGTT
ncbi:AAA family ATPase [Cuniculiplasma sp. SKW3]|uniref:AAA family ATPase n=1 Tax=Cuniculiplasma sp. SKW3 TaxID=3400170 RepID=UPI003FD2098A